MGVDDRRNDIGNLFGEIGALVVCHPVVPGLAQALTEEEALSMLNCVEVVRDRAAAARLAARLLLAGEGFPGWSMPRKHADATDWPPGYVGSLSHANEFAAAAIARREEFAGIGVDIEPAEPLPSGLRDAVVFPRDVSGAAWGALADRIIFCAKEAAYKAVYPLDREVLGFADVTVDLVAGFGEMRSGRRVSIHLHIDHRIVALARLPAISG